MARMVDLDVLKRELEAEGLEVTTRSASSIECGGFSVWYDFEVFPPLRLTTAEFAILDIIRRHVDPAPSVVLNGEEATELAAAIRLAMKANTIHPEFDALDAVLAWFAANGIVLTREERP